MDTRRVQFTPDLMPGDITGSMVIDSRQAGELTFREGPVFTNLLLADEINRTPPKTQSALLEAMEEGQVSVDGVSRKVPSPFLVAATQNPVEYEGTYPLPEAQLDRFLLKVVLPIPERDRRAGDPAPARGRLRPARRPRPPGSPRSPGRPTSPPARPRSGPSRSPTRWSATSSTSPAPPASRRRSASASARAAPPRCCARPGPGPGSPAATSSRPTTSRRWRTRRLVHRLGLRPEAELEGVDVAEVLASALGSVPVPR